MKHHNRSTAMAIAVILIAVAFTALPAMAQEITGELGLTQRHDHHLAASNCPRPSRNSAA